MIELNTKKLNLQVGQVWRSTVTEISDSQERPFTNIELIFSRMLPEYPGSRGVRKDCFLGMRLDDDRPRPCRQYPGDYYQFLWFDESGNAVLSLGPNDIALYYYRLTKRVYKRPTSSSSAAASTESKSG